MPQNGNGNRKYHDNQSIKGYPMHLLIFAPHLNAAAASTFARRTDDIVVFSEHEQLVCL